MQVAEYCVAYAVCYLDADADQNDITMHVGSDDQAKVYLNGREAYRYSRLRHIARDEDSVGGLAFKRGVNVLVLKLVNETYDWKGCVRFTDKDGRPVQGLRVSLTDEP
jgi:hypothetical protein